MKIKPGKWYRVTEGSGLDSGRVGVALNPIPQLVRRINEIDPGRYKPFDQRREQILIDDQGEYFVIFKSRLLATKNVDFQKSV